MSFQQTSTFAIHVCADNASSGRGRRWPRAIAAHDTIQRTARICQRAGITQHLTLAGEHATRAAVVDALLQAQRVLADDGLLVLTFSGHTLWEEGPPGAAQWCLFDGGLELSETCQHLARLPEGVRLIFICDSCYAAAVRRALVGPQRALVLASCGEGQTSVDRLRSEFIVRLEAFVCSDSAHGSLEDLRVLLEDDTPDCERPSVWTNEASWWSERPFLHHAAVPDRR